MDREKNKCKNCEAIYSPTIKGRDFGFCRKQKCAREQTIFLKANFDLMGDSKHRTMYEREFYKVNETQKKHYATFFSLIRPKNPSMVKGRKCLRCRVSMEYQTDRNDHHICAECHKINDRLGAFAGAI